MRALGITIFLVTAIVSYIIFLTIHSAGVERFTSDDCDNTTRSWSAFLGGNRAAMCLSIYYPEKENVILTTGTSIRLADPNYRADSSRSFLIETSAPGQDYENAVLWNFTSDGMHMPHVSLHKTRVTGPRSSVLSTGHVSELTVTMMLEYTDTSSWADGTSKEIVRIPLTGRVGAAYLRVFVAKQTDGLKLLLDEDGLSGDAGTTPSTALTWSLPPLSQGTCITLTRHWNGEMVEYNLLKDTDDPIPKVSVAASVQNLYPSNEAVRINPDAIDMEGWYMKWFGVAAKRIPKDEIRIVHEHIRKEVISGNPEVCEAMRKQIRENADYYSSKLAIVNSSLAGCQERKKKEETVFGIDITKVLRGVHPNDIPKTSCELTIFDTPAELDREFDKLTATPDVGKITLPI